MGCTITDWRWIVRMEFVGTLTQFSAVMFSKDRARHGVLKTLTPFECERLAGDKNDVGALISPFHLIVFVARGGPRLPLGARGVVQTCGLIRLAADISGADYTVPVCDSEVE